MNLDHVQRANAEELYQRIDNRIKLGKSMGASMIQQVSSMVIRDKLVSPRAMTFVVDPLERRLSLRYGAELHVTMHRHAITQLCGKVRFPLVYLSELNSMDDRAERPLWKLDQLAICLNGHYHEGFFPQDTRFLHRIVGDNLRGFLSRRFNRHLASAPLLNSFLHSCEEVGAVPFDTTVTDVKFAFKCMLPFIFEPVPGEFVCLGAEWSNSDFGAGKMQVSLTVWTPKQDRFGVLDNTLSKVHIGSVIDDADLEISDETAQKEAAAQASAIRDTVKSKLSEESVGRILGAIQASHEEQVPWHRLRGQLSRFLGKKEIQTLKESLEQEITDLPPVKSIGGEIQLSKWWAFEALGMLANRSSDPDRKLELQHAAGSFIDPFVSSKKYAEIHDGP